MANLHILEGDLMDDFGWGQGVKTNRPHLMDQPVMVRRRKNLFPHLNPNPNNVIQTTNTIYSPIQRGLNYYHQKLGLGFLKKRRGF